MSIYLLLRLVSGKPFLFDQNEEICLSVSLDNVCLINIKGFYSSIPDIYLNKEAICHWHPVLAGIT